MLLNNKNISEKVDVAWDGQCAGTVIMNGSNPNNWEWKSKNSLASRVMETEPGELPNFIKFLTVEGELASILNGDADHHQLVQKGLRFLCNIRMGVTDKCLLSIVTDEIDHHLDECTKDGGYTGKLILPKINKLTETFTDAVNNSYQSILTPKFSGFQLKMPMTLIKNSETGEFELSSAKETPFTHILKFGPKNRLMETIPVSEWVGLELSEACGLETADHALVQLPTHDIYSSREDFGLIVERFDIRSVGDDRNTGYFMSDMCSITGIFPNPESSLMTGKYRTPIEISANAVLEISSDPDADARTFFKRTAFGYFLADMDMHMKNISMLNTIDKETETITKRLSPTYDAVPSRVYPDQEFRRVNTVTSHQEIYYEPDDALSLPINGKFSNLTDEDFFVFAETMGIGQCEAQDIIFDVATNCVERAIEIAKDPPEILKDHRDARFILWRTASEVADQVQSITQMEYRDDMDGNYYTYKDYDVFCDKYKAEQLAKHTSLDSDDLSL